tara:strand:+ start:5330 stop:6538 length:1209 start_codon:yes stop_codon:yes gene_type:complete
MKNNLKFPRVPYAMTVHDSKEITAVVNTLKTSTQMGVKTKEFEKKIAHLYSKKIGLAVNSGTSALYLAMESFNIKKGSEVITPALTFATTVGCIVKNGLIPSFVDVDLNTLCIDENKIEKMINKRTKALCIPNLMGNYPNWKKIQEIAKKNNLLILEDSADIIGSTYKNKRPGYYSDITISSFYGMHIINCAGNGGIICTNNSKYAEKISLLRSWGRSSSLFTDSENIENRFNVAIDNIEYDAKFIFEEIGYNLEPSEIGSAFGLEQYKKLKKIIKIRKKVSSLQKKFFKKYHEWFILPELNPDADTIWFAFPLIIKENAPFSRKDLQIFFEKRNIQTRVIFTGNILRQPGFRNINKKVAKEGYPAADFIMKNGILIAAHHGITSKMLDHIHKSFDIFASKY